MTPSSWNAVLFATAWQPAYKAVELEVQDLLADEDNPDRQWTTNELVEVLYPQKFAIGDGIYSRNRIFQALKQLATRGLKDYCTKSTIPNKYGKYGWLWHARKADAPNMATLIDWLTPYLTLEDVALGRTEFLGTLSDRIVDDLEALERNGHV